MSRRTKVAFGLLLMIFTVAALQGRARWLHDHPFADDAAARLEEVAGRVDACLRQSGLVLSEANAPRLKRCVCVGESGGTRDYCFVGDGFVAFAGEALPAGVFRVADGTQGMAYVPRGALGPSAQEFDRNRGSFGPSTGPRPPGWYRVGFCPGCD